MPETVSPPPAPKGPEIPLSALGGKDRRGAAPDSIMQAALAAAGGSPDPTPSKADAAASPPVVTPSSPPPAAATPKPSEPPKPTAAAPAATPEPQKKKEGPAELRDALERAQRRADELQASFTATTKEKADAYAKAAALEEKVAKYEKDIKDDYTPRLQKLTEAEKRLQEMTEQLKVRDYMATPEWHEKYEKPIADASADAQALLAELSVTDETTGAVRAATQDDLAQIISAKTLNQAAAIATQLFGQHIAPTVLNLRTRLVSLTRTRQQAAEQSRVKALEWEQSRQAQFASQQEQNRKFLLEASEQELAGIKPPDDDEELKAAYAEGLSLVDRTINPPPNTTTPDFLRTVAKVRASVAKASISDKKLARIMEENAALKEQLKGYQRSEPDVIGARTTPSTGKPSDGKDDLKSKLMAAADAMARPAF